MNSKGEIVGKNIPRYPVPRKPPFHRRIKGKRYIFLAAALLLLFHFVVGFPPTSANHRPAYLRIDKENKEANVLTWVGRAPVYEVTSIRSIYFQGINTVSSQDFYVVFEPRFEETDLLEGMTYSYRVRSMDRGQIPISHWSRHVKRRLPLTGTGLNVFDHPPTPIR